MPSAYISLYANSERSFLFYVVANVGPQGSTRPLAVVYRQGNDVSPSPQARIKYLVNDILSVLKALSEPANCASLEAERARAKHWYRQHQKAGPGVRSDALPDSQQPLFRGSKDEWTPIWQPELPQNVAPTDFPVTSTCLVEGLLRGTESTRTGDVQLHPLSNPFYANCLEYGMVVIEVSNIERLKYGIVAFPVRYMAEVIYHSPDGEWDPVEDDPPRKDPDKVLVDKRPRVPLSILGYLERYFPSALVLRKDSKVLELETCPSVEDPSILDCESSQNRFDGLS